MRTFSTVAIFALALTGANAAVYTGDGAVTQSGVVTVGDTAACPVRLPAQSSLFCVGRFASVSVTTRAPARGARGICSRRERARAHRARGGAQCAPNRRRHDALARRPLCFQPCRIEPSWKCVPRAENRKRFPNLAAAVFVASVLVRGRRTHRGAHSWSALACQTLARHDARRPKRARRGAAPRCAPFRALTSARLSDGFGFSRTRVALGKSGNASCSRRDG